MLKKREVIDGSNAVDNEDITVIGTLIKVLKFPNIPKSFFA